MAYLLPDATLATHLARDAKQVGFRFARYKFVAKMLAGYGRVLEVGCGNGLGARVVAQGVGRLHATDPDITQTDQIDEIEYSNYEIMTDDPPGAYDAVYMVDVFEHIADEGLLLSTLESLAPVCIIGTPSRESQQYASAASKRDHINCKSGEELRALCNRYWKHVFMFGMNDEVLHTGFLPMAHYLFALCVSTPGNGRITFERDGAAFRS